MKLGILTAFLALNLFAVPIPINSGKGNLDLRYTACRMNGSDLEAFFGEKEKLSEGFVLSFKIANFNGTLKRNPDKNTIDLSSNLQDMLLEKKDEVRWEKPETCKVQAMLEETGIYFGIDCVNLSTIKEKKKLTFKIERRDGLVCFPSEK